MECFPEFPGVTKEIPETQTQFCTFGSQVFSMIGKDFVPDFYSFDSFEIVVISSLIFQYLVVGTLLTMTFSSRKYFHIGVNARWFWIATFFLVLSRFQISGMTNNQAALNYN